MGGEFAIKTLRRDNIGFFLKAANPAEPVPPPETGMEIVSRSSASVDE